MPGTLRQRLSLSVAHHPSEPSDEPGAPGHVWGFSSGFAGPFATNPCVVDAS